MTTLFWASNQSPGIGHHCLCRFQARIYPPPSGAIHHQPRTGAKAACHLHTICASHALDSISTCCYASWHCEGMACIDVGSKQCLAISCRKHVQHLWTSISLHSKPCRCRQAQLCWEFDLQALQQFWLLWQLRVSTTVFYCPPTHSPVKEQHTIRALSCCSVHGSGTPACRATRLNTS